MATEKRRGSTFAQGVGAQLPAGSAGTGPQSPVLLAGWQLLAVPRMLEARAACHGNLRARCLCRVLEPTHPEQLFGILAW